MSIWDNLPDKIRNIFDDGFDEVLVFAIVFIFILISGQDSNCPGKADDSAGIFPLIVIGLLLLLFTGFCRNGEIKE